MRHQRKSRPFIMRGAPRITKERPTIADPPDRRVPEPPRVTVTVERLRAVGPHDRTDPRLRAVDLCLWRWAITPGGTSYGTGMAAVVLGKRTSQILDAPLDDAQSKIVDVAIRSSPEWARRFVNWWYRDRLWGHEIAEAMKAKSLSAIYDERERVLFYLSGRLSMYHDLVLSAI